ncbi:hypothetical protein D2A86_10095 [Enterococcus faecalis]|nr:hypothetical protein [Enterococcus faecalis]EGO9160568.1 hypothetical protein [Enterococcus faecalis]
MKKKKGIKKDKQSFRQELKKSTHFILGAPGQKRETGKTIFLFLFVFILYLLSIFFTYIL